MKYLLNDPQVFDSLPDKFELVVLPDDDPEMRLYNLELLDKWESENKPIVFARIKTLRDKGSNAIKTKPVCSNSCCGLTLSFLTIPLRPLE